MTGDTPAAAAREVAMQRIMAKLRWGEPLTRLLPADIASAVRDDITAALLAFRRAALEDAAKVAEAAYESRNHADRSPRHIASAIRALAGSTKEGE